MVPTSRVWDGESPRVVYGLLLSYSMYMMSVYVVEVYSLVLFRSLSFCIPATAVPFVLDERSTYQTCPIFVCCTSALVLLHGIMVCKAKAMHAYQHVHE